MQELQEETFFGNKNDDAHKHVERVLDIVSLFNIPGVAHNAVMLRVFPITLTRAAKRWVDKLSLRTVDSWDLLKRSFIQRYCPPSKTAKQLEEICNFKQEGDETLYPAWERNYEPPIARLWHDGSSSRNIDSNSSSEGITTNVRSHLDKEYPLNEKVKSMEEARYGEFSRHFLKLDSIEEYRDTSHMANHHQLRDEQTGGKFEECKAIFTEDRSPLYTPFYYSPEEIEYFSANSSFSNDEKHETKKVEVSKALATLDIAPNVKMVSQEEKQNLPPKEQDQGSFILPYSIGRLDFNNTLADLGASINVMPFSMYTHLGMGKLEPISMVIEMANNTKCTPKGIVKNLLIKTNKFIFPVEFVILDMVEDFRMPIILGRPLLAIGHAKVDIFWKSISLKVGNEKVIFKMRNSFTTTIVESVRAIRSETRTEDDDLINIDYDLFLYDSESCEFIRLLGIDPDIFSYDIDIHESYEEIVYRMTDQAEPCEIEALKETNIETHLTHTGKRVHWCEAILQGKENVHQYWASSNPYSDICDGKGLSDNKDKHYRENMNDSERREKFNEDQDDIEVDDREDPKECGKDKANSILEVVLDKLYEAWFNGTSEDEDDLDGILDYLQPK
ncbi:zinc knuckle CX2CX4HX4C containing protein [Tanacetum coccineum]